MRLVEVERAGCTRARALEDVEVNHGGGDVGVAEEVLNGADFGAVLEQARREGMAHRVATGWLGNVGFADGVSELPLHGCLMEVMAGDPSGAGMRAEGASAQRM